MARLKFVVQHASADPQWVAEIVSPTAVARFARAAEESGFTALAFTDHPAPPRRWAQQGGEGSIDPFSALGFCAAITTSIHLLTFVLVLPYRNPFITAHQTASLDALSGGRLIVGAGTGYLKGEFRALGIDFADRRAAFDEAVAVMQTAWSASDVSWEGSTFVTHGTNPRPAPVQRPGPPLWVHGNGRWGLDRAARYGKGWFGILADSDLAKTMRTKTIVDLDGLARRIDDLRTRTMGYGREASAVEAVVSGYWPMLDVRTGWDKSRLQHDVVALEQLGVDRIVVVVCGDDAGAAEDTVRQFGDDVVSHCS
ncbi:LLM class F420-dependent oxidoreductase [Mycobacterium sp. MUNTM1]